MRFRSMYFIYGIEHDMHFMPLWVGMTDNPDRRFKQHLTTNKKLIEELNDLRKLEHDPVWSSRSFEPRMCIYAQTEDKQEAIELERHYIHLLHPSFNIKDNGAVIKKAQELEAKYEIYVLFKESFQVEKYDEIAVWDFASKVFDMVKGGTGA